MQGEMVPVVLVPRSTSWCAGSIYSTAPLDVTAYDRLVVLFDGASSDPVAFQESHDSVTWFDLATATSPTQVRVDLTRRWLRLHVDLTGEGDGFAGCCVGSLRRRID